MKNTSKEAYSRLKKELGKLRMKALAEIKRKEKRIEEEAPFFKIKGEFYPSKKEVEDAYEADMITSKQLEKGKKFFDEYEEKEEAKLESLKIYAKILDNLLWETNQSEMEAEDGRH